MHTDVAGAAVARAEVVMSWGGVPQAQALVRPGQRVMIGEGEGATFMVPALDSLFELIGSDESAGTISVRAPSGATLRAEKNGAPLELAEGVALAIEPGVRAEIAVGEIAFFVSSVGALEAPPPPARVDWRSHRWALASLLVHGIFVGALFLAPPRAGALSLDLTADQERYIHMHLDGYEQVQPELPIEVSQDDRQGAESGTPMQGDEGTAGAPDETRHTGGGVQVRGSSDDHRVPLTRDSVAQMVSSSSIATIFAGQQALSSPFGAAEAQGWSESEAYGSIMADQLGFGPGTAGFGMRGTGRGGGCQPGQPCAAGTIGFGGIGSGGWGTCSRAEFDAIQAREGRGAAVASCTPGMRGGDSGVGGALDPGGRPHRDRVPHLTMLDAQTTGGLTREDIRRVVTRNRHQVRFCYEQELQSRPDLAGRITVRWTITAEGRVMSSAVQASDMHNADVEQCVASAVARWVFPSSESPTAVSYPFVFESR